MKKIDNFINEYSLSKTLRFQLIPVGKTEENFENKLLLEADEKRAKDYVVVKGYLDRLYRSFIEKSLSRVNLEGVREYAEMYYSANRDDLSISKMEDGYYNYKNNNTRVLIKDFDVQHPELRVYGTRSKETLTIQDIDKDKDEELDNNQSKKYSIVLNKRILNFKRNSPIKIKNMKYMKEPKTDNRIKYNINKNKKQISFKKIVPDRKSVV